MSEQHENISWKQVAIQEIKQCRILEHKVKELQAGLLRAKKILQCTQNYKEHLETCNSQLEHQYATKTADFQRAANLLQKAKSLLQQRQIEIDIVTQENTSLNSNLQQLQTELEIATQENTRLNDNLQQNQTELELATQENTRLQQELQQQIELLHAEMTRHEDTQHRLNLALQQLELAQKINALPVAQPQIELSSNETNLPEPNQSHLHEFFVYKPFISRV